MIYGNKEKPVMISLDRLKFDRILRTPGFFTHLFDVKVGDASYHVLPRDVQFDPVTDTPIHVDFLRVSGKPGSPSKSRSSSSTRRSRRA